MSLSLSLLAAALTTCLTLLALLASRRPLPLDHPNERSLHNTPTPRIGGLGIVAGVAVGLALRWLPEAWPLVLPAGALVVVSLLDDFLDLPARWRLLAHMVAAVSFLSLMPPVGWGMSLAVFFALVWMTNIYNFMDGADGLAGGMALIGFGAYALLAGQAGDTVLLTVSASVVAAALGFLLFNFPPARLFMGDAGSVPLGFLVAAVSFLGWRHGVWSWSMPLLIFSPFIVDANVTLFKRALRGKRIWQAHREHYYQRLVRAGWSHRRLVLSEYALMAAAVASALWLAKNPQWQGAVVLIWGAFYVAVMVIIDRRWREVANAA